jgi:hypothetical protein
MSKHEDIKDFDHYDIHEYLTLEWDDGTAVECMVLAQFEFEGKTYIALQPEEEDEAYIYTFAEDEEQNVDLGTLEKEEFEKVSEYFLKNYADQE